MFDTDTGVSSLLLKEVPYKQVAYIRVQSVQPGGLSTHLKECVGFCRMCGAERVLAQGHAELESYPLHCAVLTMSGPVSRREPPAMVFPVTEQTVRRWREIYNEKMAPVDNAATMTAFDEKKILASAGAVFVHENGGLLGIGWVSGSEILCVRLTRSSSPPAPSPTASPYPASIRVFRPSISCWVSRRSARMSPSLVAA